MFIRDIKHCFNHKHCACKAWGILVTRTEKVTYTSTFLHINYKTHLHLSMQMLAALKKQRNVCVGGQKKQRHCLHNHVKDTRQKGGVVCMCVRTPGCGTVIVCMCV